jgi:hypothetical protein
MLYPDADVVVYHDFIVKYCVCGVCVCVWRVCVVCVCGGGIDMAYIAGTYQKMIVFFRMFTM